MPEIHPLGPGPPAPTGHRLPAPASISQKLSAVPVSQGLGAAVGTHHRAQAVISRSHSTFRKGSSSSPHLPRTCRSFRDQDVFPTLKMKCLLPIVFAALRAVLAGQTSPGKPHRAWSLPTPRTQGPPVLIREPVSLFRRMNKTSGQETFCCVPWRRKSQGKTGALGENCVCVMSGESSSVPAAPWAPAPAARLP